VECAPADVSSRLDDAGGARSAFDGLAVESFPRNGAERPRIRLVLCEEQFLAREGIIRVLDSMQLTAKHKVATPANWKQGEDVIITGAVSNDDAAKLFPGYKTVKPYLRTTSQPQ